MPSWRAARADEIAPGTSVSLSGGHPYALRRRSTSTVRTSSTSNSCARPACRTAYSCTYDRSLLPRPPRVRVQDTLSAAVSGHAQVLPRGHCAACADRDGSWGGWGRGQVAAGGTYHHVEYSMYYSTQCAVSSVGSQLGGGATMQIVTVGHASQRLFAHAPGDSQESASPMMADAIYCLYISGAERRRTRPPKTGLTIR